MSNRSLAGLGFPVALAVIVRGLSSRSRVETGWVLGNPRLLVPHTVASPVVIDASRKR